MSDFCAGPGTMGLPPTKDHKGGAGEYNGIPGWTGRTPSPNAVPEKFMDSAVKPVSQDKKD